jgi:hypothetical protein
MTRTRLSLCYLGAYLVAIGLGLLAAPHTTLAVLGSHGDYGDIFPRVAGMFMSGLGLSVFGMIRSRSESQYLQTLVVRGYFIACLATFFTMTRDPFFVVLIAIVGVGAVLTLGSYALDRVEMRSVHRAHRN